MIKVDYDKERIGTPLSFREKLVVRLILFLIAMIYPAQFDHQLKAWLLDIDSK